MKRILGLDLGSNSIGWALVNEAENIEEKSSIERIGVRIIHYDNFVSSDTGKEVKGDPADFFKGGKGVSPNASRTKSRAMRRNLQRYKLRRENLIEILKNSGFISNENYLSENGKNTTFETYRLRAKAVDSKVSLDQLARILLMINKKRGYKSSRKINAQEEGQSIDAMEIAKRISDEDLTPGQYSYRLLQSGTKGLPDFYQSDLQNEFNKIWAFQTQYYPDILHNDLKDNLLGKNKNQTWAICEVPFCIEGIKREKKGDELKKENFEWRSKAVSEKIDLERLAIVLQEINSQIVNSSNYLGALSDRTKELYFKKQTIGQLLYSRLEKNPNNGLKNLVFYRQDYLDEFNRIWDKQSEFYTELTNELKEEIRDVIIFYQRRLKSQKGLISFCEFESKQIELEIDGKKKIKTIGQRVIPKSSPLFQEFKIWQNLNNIIVSSKSKQGIDGNSKQVPDSISFVCENEKRELYQEEKEILASELYIREKLTKTEALKLLFKNYQDLDLNFDFIEGNRTQSKFIKSFVQILELTGHRINLKKSANEVLEDISDVFEALNFNSEILWFDSQKPLDEQPNYKLWHLLYSFEGDNSKTGSINLINKLSQNFGFDNNFAVILSKITFLNEYGNLSARAIRKILPYLREGNKYSLACEYAGYRHSKSSLKKEEIDNKVLIDRLMLLQKNSLRNPVVEKILNQLVNVTNSIIDVYGKPDEVRIELARELKKNARERQEMTLAINKTTIEHGEIKTKLEKEFGISYVSRNDIIRYKLYEELKSNGYKTLYSNTYIPQEKLFSKEFDIEHIIPQSRLFDDSFSNKTLESRAINIEKGDSTAFDFIKHKYGEVGVANYLDKIENLYKIGSYSKAKYNKLKMKEIDIPNDFIDRDLRDTQYIAKKAKSMFENLVYRVVSTTGSITDRLREDWQLVNVMQELNWDKYNKMGLTEHFNDKDGKRIGRIKDWSKRNDHRHHAMDALTVAFTKDAYIQYFNNQNARYDKGSNIYAIEKKYFVDRKVAPPMPMEVFRSEVKKHLENTLVSIKAKNKVVTNNINITKKHGGVNKKIQQTPRGQLHLETIYGSQKKTIVKEEKVDGKFDKNKIATVTKPIYREALLKRLIQFNDDPIKAFTGKNSLSKSPIVIKESLESKVYLPEKVKTVSFDTIYTIRKEVSKDLKIEKVIDLGLRRILEKRLNDYGTAEKAFSNLDKDPKGVDETRGLGFKKVTITGINNAEPLHFKRDKDGQLIFNCKEEKLPVDFINTGNNHHVAIYRDSDGFLHEDVVSLLKAVTRKNFGIPIVDKNYNKSEGWEFLFSMKKNEYFVFPNIAQGFDPSEVDLLSPDNYYLISQNLFRVQKFTSKDYFFRHHLETSIENKKELSRITWIRCGLNDINSIIKVRLDHIGRIVSIGEYL